MKQLNPSLDRKPLQFFLKVNRKNLPILALNIVFYSFGSAVMFLASYFFGRSIDALNSGTSAATHFLIFAVMCILAHEVFYRTGHICEIYLLSKIRRNVKNALFDHTAKLSFGYFTDRFAGEIAHKVSTTADAFEKLTSITTNGFFEGGFLIPVAMITLGLVHPYYAVFILAWTLFLVIGSVLLSREMNRRAGAYAEQEARTTGSVVDVYGNISTVKVYGNDSSAKSTYTQIEREQKAYLNFGWWDVLTFNFEGIASILLFTGLIVLTSRLYFLGTITVGDIAFIASGSWLLYNVAWEMGRDIAGFIRSRGEAIQNLDDLVVAPSVLDGAEAGDVRESVGIEYRTVSFGYLPGRSVLDAFSIVIQPGQKVGIVGLSGAGKTTFANLLLRFFDPKSGEVLLNGIDIRNFTQEFLRSHISYISQDTSLFHTSISENIAYGMSHASPEDIQHAARLAYADEFIDSLPHKYESIVGDRGIKLSGGQRQRIAIARAILADRPLFLLDEATSALDSDSEAKIQKGLATLMEDKTVIAIAHRLSTLSHMDRIVFLENGKIIEDGTACRAPRKKWPLCEIVAYAGRGILAGLSLSRARRRVTF